MNKLLLHKKNWFTIIGYLIGIILTVVALSALGWHWINGIEGTSGTITPLSSLAPTASFALAIISLILVCLAIVPPFAGQFIKKEKTFKALNLAGIALAFSGYIFALASLTSGWVDLSSYAEIVNLSKDGSIPAALNNVWTMGVSLTNGLFIVDMVLISFAELIPLILEITFVFPDKKRDKTDQKETKSDTKEKSEK